MKKTKELAKQFGARLAELDKLIADREAAKKLDSEIKRKHLGAA